MEAARDAAASGGCSIRDLPPSKRFKFVGTHLGSAPGLPLPAKKRAFPPLPEAAPAPACLPAKKRSHAPAVMESAVKICLPAKKRAYAPPVDDISPARVPSKTRVHVHPPTPQDAAPPPSVPSKKSVQAPERRQDVAAPLSVPAKKQVQMPSRLVADTAAPSVPAKKRVQAPSPLGLRHSAAPPTVAASKRVQVPSATEEAAAPSTAPAKKRVQPPSATQEAAAPPTAPVKKRAQVPSSTEVAAAHPSVPAKQHVLVPSCQDRAFSASSVQAKQRLQVPSCPDATNAAPSIQAKKRVQARSLPEDAAAPPSVPAKQRVPVPSRLERPVAAPSVPAKQPILVPSRPEGAAVALSVTADKGVPSPSAREDASALFPVCLPANKRVMSQFIPPSQSRSVKPDVDRAAAAKEARPAVANGGADCPRAEASKMPEKPNELKDQVVTKSRRANTARKASDLHCKKLSDVINGMQSEDQAGVLNTFEQSEVAKTPEQAIDPKVAAQAPEEEPKQDALLVEEEDDGVLCAVCRSTDGDPSDPIVFCDGCDLMVHATCYGNPLAQSIPDGDWFCSLCSDKGTTKKGKPARPPCRLCPGRGGAMKRTTEGAWAHIECALLVPEVFFQDPDGRDAVDCSLVPSRRFTKHCYLCESNRGCALECSQPKCDLGFHVSCGLNGGLTIEYREEKGGAIVAGFCLEHTKIWEKQQLTGKYKIVSRGHA
ncbi:unnamed protein product [Alopecurus aequalis]